ncbi:MAG: WD40 repeat domain-containing protein [Bacteroidota bacterium]|jgi:WD repeat-containing protein 61
MGIQVKKSITLRGHNAAIYCLCKGWDENTIISGSGDKYIAQWNIEEGIQDKFSALLPAPIFALLYVKDFSQLWVGTSNGHIHVIDVKNKKEIHDFNFHTGHIYDIQYDSLRKMVYSSGGDGCINIYNPESMKHIHRNKFSNEKIRSIYCYENFLLLAEGSGRTIVLNASDFSIINEFQSHQFASNCHLLINQSSELISGGRDAKLNLWDIKNNYNKIKSVPAHNYAIYRLIDIEESEYFASASRDKTIKIWNKKDLSPILRINKEKFDGHAFSVNALLWLKHTNKLVSAGDDKQIMVWEVAIN